MSEWKEYALGDLYNVSSGLSKAADQFGFGTTFISFKDVFNNYFLPENPDGLVNSNEKEQKSCSVKAGDILLTRTSETIEEVGMSSVALKDYEKSTFNGFCKRLRIKKDAPVKVSSMYIGYLLRTRFFRKAVANYATMTTRASLNSESIKSIPLPFPSYATQEEIGKTLHNLERKISLLKQQNQTLEELSQTLFKHWFVKFEFPFENGEPYKTSGGKMVESELGEIPEGWRVGILSEIADITIGRTPPRKESQWFSTNKDDIKWVSIKDMGDSGLFIINTSEYLTKEAVERFRIPVIPENTTILSFKLTVGRVAITTENMLSNEAIAHVHLHDEYDYFQYSYLLLKGYNYDRLGSTSSIATAVNSNSIKNMEVLIPNTETIKEFDKHTIGIFDKIRNNTNEIYTLAQLRDTLLPNLMSGELQVEINTGG